MVLKGLGPYHKYGLSLNLAHVKSDERKFIFKFHLNIIYPKLEVLKLNYIFYDMTRVNNTGH